MPRGQRVIQGGRKFWKGPADAVWQFVEEIIAFFDEGRHVPSEILAERQTYFRFQPRRGLSFDDIP